MKIITSMCCCNSKGKGRSNWIATKIHYRKIEYGGTDIQRFQSSQISWKKNQILVHFFAIYMTTWDHKMGVGWDGSKAITFTWAAMANGLTKL